VIAVWFDIDGTLLDTGGSGGNAFKQALRRQYQLDDDMDYIRFAGATDLQIVRDVFKHNNFSSPPEDIQRFFDSLDQEYETAFTATPPRILEGARDLLEALSRHDAVTLGLLTGNAERLAYTKLRHVQLEHFFDHGGFGDQHPCRNELATLALQQATERYGTIHQSFVLGDTPRDVEAAHAIGATSIAVATGRYSTSELKATGAQHVLPDFTDYKLVETLIIS